MFVLTVGSGVKSLDWVGLGLDSPGLSRSCRQSFQLDSLSVRLGLLLLTRILLDSSQEVVSALGVLDVLNTHRHPLLEVSVSDNLVEDDSD